MKIETELKLKPENYRNYQQLLAQIEASDRTLSLLIAVCDDKRLRERIISQYEAELQPEIRPYRLRLDKDEPSLRMAIVQLLQKEEYLRHDGRAVLTVTGADELLFISLKGERTEQDKFFGYLQWTREGLRAFPYPVVLWVTNQILVNLSEKAPDFWSWRKGVFRFESETSVATLPPENGQRPSLGFEEDSSNFIPLEDLQDLIARTEQKRGKKDPTLATLYDHLGELYRQRLERGEAENYPDERERAFQCFYKAIDLQTELGLRSDLVNSLTHLGLLHYFLAQYKQAIDCHQKSLKIAREIGDRWSEGDSLINLGNAYYFLGQYQPAIAFYQQSLEIAGEIGDRQGEANSLGNLGIAYKSLGQYQQAIEFYQQSLEIKREIGDRQGEGASLGNLGLAYHSLGQYQQAIEFHQQSLEIAREIGDRQGEANSYGNLGLAYQSLGEHQRAIEYLLQTLDIAREIGDRQGEANSLGDLGISYNSLGQYQQAIEFHQQQLEIAREIGDKRGEANSWFNLGLALAKLNRESEAIEAYRNARELYQSMGLDAKVQDCDNEIERLS